MHIIGFYTDIKKDRLTNRIYKNPFVIGAIIKNGKIVGNVNDLLAAIRNYIRTKIV
jgi:Pyruvate/2-oxoacid:ferredoxin oxidoreductase gamma subunit